MIVHKCEELLLSVFKCEEVCMIVNESEGL